MSDSSDFDEPLNGTVRQRMFALLTKDQQDARTLSQQLRISEKEVITHLPHLELTARKQGLRLIILSSECLSCGFSFKDRKRPKKPGRCPNCKSTHLSMPAYRIE